MKRIIVLLLCLLIITAGCNNTKINGNLSDDKQDKTSDNAYMPNWNKLFSKRDKSGLYDENNICYIECSGENNFKINGQGAASNGKTCIVAFEGTYIFSGKCTDAAIDVRAMDNAKIQIVLNNADITNKSGSVIFSESASKVFVTTADSSVNYLTDGKEYDALYNEDAVIYSKTDLTLNGTGELNIIANYSHGIVSKDTLTICGGSYNISAVNTAVCGKDSLNIDNGNFSITSCKTAFKSNNINDEEKGNIYLYGGTYNINSREKAFAAEKNICVLNGNFQITTGEGSSVLSKKEEKQKPGEPFNNPNSNKTDENDADSELKPKAFKSGNDILISNGNFIIDSEDDSIHADNDIVIFGGNFELSSGDDAIHADNCLSINKADISVKKCYEGLEAQVITIDGGTINIVSSDDGINAFCNSSDAKVSPVGKYSDSCKAVINDGNIYIDSGGDGIDVNGSIYVNGGIIIINSSEKGADSALDYDVEGIITGGTVMLLGTSEMAMNFGSSSTQCTFLCNMAVLQGNVRFSCIDSEGNIIASMIPSKSFSSVVISSPSLAIDNEYSLCTGGIVNSNDNFIDSGKIVGESVIGKVKITKTASTFGN